MMRGTKTSHIGPAPSGEGKKTRRRKGRRRDIRRFSGSQRRAKSLVFGVVEASLALAVRRSNDAVHRMIAAHAVPDGVGEDRPSRSTLPLAVPLAPWTSARPRFIAVIRSVPATTLDAKEWVRPDEFHRRLGSGIGSDSSASRSLGIQYARKRLLAGMRVTPMKLDAARAKSINMMPFFFDDTDQQNNGDDAHH
jgi:hypothetical protein